MTKRTKIILLILVAVTAIATVFAAWYKPVRRDSIIRPIIKIGIMLPLSGNQTHLGTAARQAIEKYLAEREPTAGYRYEVVFKDYSSLGETPADTASDLLFSLEPEPRVAITIGQNDNNPIVLHTPYADATALLAQDLKNQNLTNIGFITENTGNYRSLAKAVRDSLAEGSTFNGAVFSAGQTDFKALINKLRNADTQVFVLTGNPHDLDNLIQALNSNGISNYQISSLYSIDLTSRPELYNNIRFVGSVAGAYDSALVTEALLHLIKAYEANYKKDLIPNAATVRAYLEKNSVKNGELVIPALMKKVEDGKIISAKE